eukprot:scaffold12582_cov126-Isochrysis_galbana.AAC.2
MERRSIQVPRSATLYVPVVYAVDCDDPSMYTILRLVEELARSNTLGAYRALDTDARKQRARDLKLVCLDVLRLSDQPTMRSPQSVANFCVWCGGVSRRL